MSKRDKVSNSYDSFMDEFDVEYSVEVKSYFKFFNKGNNQNSDARTFSITRRILPSLRNLQLLRKNGAISWLKYGWLSSKVFFEKHLNFFGIFAIVSGIIGVFATFFIVRASALGNADHLGLFFTLLLGALLITIMATLLSSLDLPTMFSKIFRKSDVNENQTRTVVADRQAHVELCSLMENKSWRKTIDQKTLKTLFKKFENSSFNVNEEIDKIMKAKKDFVNETGIYSSDRASLVASDLDKAFDELLKLRNSDKNDQILKELSDSLSYAVELAEDEKLAESVNVLSNVSSFIQHEQKNSNKNDSEVLEVVESLNKRYSSDDDSVYVSARSDEKEMRA